MILAKCFFKIYPYFSLGVALVFTTSMGYGQIDHDVNAKVVRITTTDQRLSLLIDYASGAKVTKLLLNNGNTLAPKGIFTALRTANNEWVSGQSASEVQVSINDNKVEISGISLGEAVESWSFSLTGDKVMWTISRTYLRDIVIEEMGMPTWQFVDLNTWKGGILDNGGMVWCKYLASPNDTYGVHTGGVTFWNEDKVDALRIAAKTGAHQEIAAKFTHDESGAFSYMHIVSEQTMQQRHNLSRFVHGKDDVFAPFEASQGTVRVTYELSYVDYLKTYDRGHLPGIDVSAVRELLNTTGRYGVVDNNIVGANGWITNWKCLHEPFFAQIGLALNDNNYTENLAATLDRERDFAMLPNGRVLSRWHDVPGDEIPGTYNAETGYYEAMWGYTVDSQTGYVINTAELFQQTGDLNWLRGHKASVERALDWVIKRDSNGNGVFEMVNNNVAEEKASDWIDIVWAGFENAFVNAQLYEALRLWGECEWILGDTGKATHYLDIAERLKEAFNKDVADGGFWSSDKKQYVYWRDQDGTIRGDNLVTPVNFAAIAFGICDDEQRIDTVLGHIEQRMEAEDLFHWPLCFDSFEREEVHDNNWPFPRYENGDIFPTWGYLGIRSYVKYNKSLALKYIRNMLAQYRRDGLSSQRYSRIDQKGLGTDILAGISTTVTALYSDMYGIRPKWNRLGLEPNLVADLNGTHFTYSLRDTVYKVLLNADAYELRTSEYSVKSTQAFGVGKLGKDIVYYPGNKESNRLVMHADRGGFADLSVTRWESGVFQWSVGNKHKGGFTIRGLKPQVRYRLITNHGQKELVVGNDGTLSIPTPRTGSPTRQYELRCCGA